VIACDAELPRLSACCWNSTGIPFIAVQNEDFVRSYEGKSDEELLRLQLNIKDLPPDGTVALTNELAKRNIGSPEHLDAFRKDVRRQGAVASRNPGSSFLYFRLGIGRWNLGKANRIYDQRTDIERFSTTIFILFLWFPLIPTGSYWVEQKRAGFRKRVTILKKLPLDWSQVLRVWAVALACLLIVVWVLKRM
jgi:hypothetical protein